MPARGRDVDVADVDRAAQEGDEFRRLCEEGGEAGRLPVGHHDLAAGGVVDEAGRAAVDRGGRGRRQVVRRPGDLGVRPAREGPPGQAVKDQLSHRTRWDRRQDPRDAQTVVDGEDVRRRHRPAHRRADGPEGVVLGQAQSALLRVDAQPQVSAAVRAGQELLGQSARLVHQLRVDRRADEVLHVEDGSVAGRPFLPDLFGERGDQVPPQPPAVEVRQEPVVRTGIHKAVLHVAGTAGGRPAGSVATTRSSAGRWSRK